MCVFDAAHRFELHNEWWQATFALDDGLWLVVLTDRRAGVDWLDAAGPDQKAAPDGRLKVAWPSVTLAITLDGPNAKPG